MNKILALGALLLLCLGLIAGADPDLTVKELTLKADKFESRGSYGYVLKVQNVGNTVAQTRLPLRMYLQGATGGETVAIYPLLSNQVTERVTDGEVKPVKVIAVDGTEKKETPFSGELVYNASALMPAELEAELAKLQSRLTASGTSSEEMEKQLKETKEKLSQRHEQTATGWFVNLEPGEILVFDSEGAYFPQDNKVTFPAGIPSLEKQEVNYVVELDPFGEADMNPYNNKYETTFQMEPNIKQGPLAKSSQNVALSNGKEYFSSVLGCGKLKETEFCVDMDKEEKFLSITVNGEKQDYELYGLFMNWLSKTFSDGKLTSPKTIGGVEVTIYEQGFKLKDINN